VDSDSHPDVVIVGAGVAGGALATLLARAGRGVLLIERRHAFLDRVRGEYLAPWGVAEALRVGLLDDLMSVEGSGFITRYVPYDEVYRPEEAEARAIDLGALLPGVQGALGLSHPGACAGLAQAAAAAGATVLHGVSGVSVSPGPRPSVSFSVDGRRRRLRCRLIVGADGRRSLVRTQLGIALRETRARTFGAGLLVSGLSRWPAATLAIGTEHNVHYGVFPRASGVARLYVFCALEDRARLRGPGAASRLLAALRLACLPGSDELAGACPAGPCAGFPMNDTWTDAPGVPGAVLVGDAAGSNDPIIGQGLSLALCDARAVADALSADDWGPSTLALYAAERRERHRRLRLSAAVMTELKCAFTPEGRRRRQRVFELFRREPGQCLAVAALLVGPHRVPPHAFEAAALERLLADPSRSNLVECGARQSTR
jgi:2-polyprenyl-6-methoxyphenol hydroxylase-like FAD-dependent oxidoreductase